MCEATKRATACLELANALQTSDEHKFQPKIVCAKLIDDLALALCILLQGWEQPLTPESYELSKEYMAVGVTHSLADYIKYLTRKTQIDLKWPWTVMLYAVILLARLLHQSGRSYHSTQSGAENGWDDANEIRNFEAHLSKVWRNHPKQLKRIRDGDAFTYRNATPGPACFHLQNQHYMLAVCVNLAQKVLLDPHDTLQTKQMAKLLGYDAEYVNRLSEQEYQTCCRLNWQLHVEQCEAREMALELVAIVYHHYRCCDQQTRLQPAFAQRQQSLVDKCWHSWRAALQRYQAECQFDDLRKALAQNKSESMAYEILDPMASMQAVETMDTSCQICEVV